MMGDPDVCREEILPLLDAEGWGSLRGVCSALRRAVDRHCANPAALREILYGLHALGRCPFVLRCDDSDELVAAVVRKHFPAALVTVGDTVRYRNTGEQWRTGIVREVVNGRPMMHCWDGNAFFDEVEYIAVPDNWAHPPAPPAGAVARAAAGDSAAELIEAPLFAALDTPLLAAMWRVAGRRALRSHPDCSPRFLTSARDVSDCLCAALAPFYRDLHPTADVAARALLLRQWALLRASMTGVTETHTLHTYYIEYDGPCKGAAAATISPLLYEERRPQEA